MNKDIFENNRVEIEGVINGGFKFSHESYGEGFYLAYLDVKRKSETIDTIPVLASDRLIDTKTDWAGKRVKVVGQFRSYNHRDDDGNHLHLSVFARELSEAEENPGYDKNEVFLDGYICKQPNLRHLLNDRVITDVLVAVNRPYRRSGYLPCIVWGRNASFASSLEVGTRVQMRGRIQSRTYVKAFPDGETVVRTCYEVSAQTIQIVIEGDRVYESKDTEHA